MRFRSADASFAVSILGRTATLSKIQIQNTAGFSALVREAADTLLHTDGVTRLMIVGKDHPDSHNLKKSGFRELADGSWLREPKRVLLLPFVESGIWFWPELEVRAESSFGPELGRGVFAKTDLRPGLFFPIFGTPISEAEHKRLIRTNQQQFVFAKGRGEPRLLLNGDPRCSLPGRHGLEIALMVNEPPPRVKANCALGPNTLQVRRFIAKGEELLVHYGDSYTRSYKVGQRCHHTVEPREAVTLMNDYVKEA